MLSVRILLVAEMELDLPESAPPEIVEAEAQRQLDAFREAVQPSSEHDILLYRAPESFNRKDYL